QRWRARWCPGRGPRSSSRRPRACRLTSCTCAAGTISPNAPRRACARRSSCSSSPSSPIPHTPWHTPGLPTRTSCSASTRLEGPAAMQRPLAVDPLFPIVSTNLGRADAFARRFDEAVAHYRLALEMEPGFLPAQFELARVLALQGAFKEARAVCRAAREGAPDSVRPLVAMAWVEARAGAVAARTLLAELEERATREYVPHYY